MKLKISNHSSFNLKGTGRNTPGNFYLGQSSEMVGVLIAKMTVIKGVTRDLLVFSQSWPNLVFRLNRPRGIQWCLYFFSSMCGLEVRRVARYSRAPSFSAVFYRIEIFYLIIFYPNGTYKTSTSFFHHMFSLYFLIRYVFEWQKKCKMSFKLNELPPAALLNQRGWSSLLRSWYHYSDSTAHEKCK